MHVCPQLKNLPNNILMQALSILADSSTITGHLPPSYKIQGVKFLAASIPTNLPVIVDPVKQIKSKGIFVIALATSTFPSMHL